MSAAAVSSGSVAVMNSSLWRLVAAVLFSPLLEIHAAIPSAIAFWRSWKSIVIDTILARAMSPHAWLSTINFSLSLVLSKSRMVQARSSGRSVSIPRYLQYITHHRWYHQCKAISKCVVLHFAVFPMNRLCNTEERRRMRSTKSATCWRRLKRQPWRQPLTEATTLKAASAACRRHSVAYAQSWSACLCTWTPSCNYCIKSMIIINIAMMCSRSLSLYVCQEHWKSIASAMEYGTGIILTHTCFLKDKHCREAEMYIFIRIFNWERVNHMCTLILHGADTWRPNLNLSLHSKADMHSNALTAIRSHISRSPTVCHCVWKVTWLVLAATQLNAPVHWCEHSLLIMQTILEPQSVVAYVYLAIRPRLYSIDKRDNFVNTVSERNQIHHQLPARKELVLVFKMLQPHTVIKQWCRTYQVSFLQPDLIHNINYLIN